MEEEFIEQEMREYSKNNFKEKYGIGNKKPKAKRQWVLHSSQETCESCKAMNGQIREIGEQFTDPKGVFDPVDRPPLHKNCKCSLRSV